MTAPPSPPTAAVGPNDAAAQANRSEPELGSESGSGTVRSDGSSPDRLTQRQPRRRGVRTVLCWMLVLPGVFWCAVRLSGWERGPLVQLMAFTPYVAIGSLLPLGLAVALRRRWAAVVAALTAAALLAVVAPRALPEGMPNATGPTLRVATANLLKGTADPAALVDLVRRHRIDVLALQEYTPAAQEALDRAGLSTLLGHRQVNPEESTIGSALYSRFPLRDGGVRRNEGGFTQAYATVAVPGAPEIPVESVHPLAPSSLGTLPYWRVDLAAHRPHPTDRPGSWPVTSTPPSTTRRCAGCWPPATATRPRPPDADWSARGGRTTAT